MIRLFKVSIPSSVIALVISEVILAISCYVVTAYLIMDVSADVYLFDDGGIWQILLVAVVILIGLYFQDLYDDFRIRSRILVVQQVSLVLGIAFVIQLLSSYGRLQITLPKQLMLYGTLAALVVLPAWRMLYSSVLAKALGGQRMLFLGAAPAVHDIVGRIHERPDLGLSVIGYLGQDKEVGSIDGVPCLGELGELEQVVATRHPDRIIVGLSERRMRLPVEKLLRLRFSGIHIEEAASTFESLFSRISTRDLRPSQIIFSQELGPQPRSVQLQAIYSWVIGLVALILLAPLMLVVALLIRITSPGPALFGQTRVGLNGKLFTVYKFRSMYRDAEARTGAVWATKDDPRITPLGKWLRLLRIEELPQLINVIKAGYTTAAGLYGIHRFFHTAADDLRCTSGELVLPIAQAFRAAIPKFVKSAARRAG